MNKTGNTTRTKKELGKSSKKFDSPQMVTNNEKVSTGKGGKLNKKLEDILETPNPMDPAGKVNSASGVVMGPDGKPINPAQGQSSAPQASMGGDVHK